MRPYLHLLSSVFCLLLFCLSSCAVKRPAPGMIPTAPAVAAPMAPQVLIARQAADATGTVSSKLETQVQVLKQSTTTLQSSLAKSFIEATRLRDLKTATEKDLDLLAQDLGDSKALTQNLVDEVTLANTTADEQRSARLKSDAALEELTISAANKDSENSVLRSQNIDLGATVTQSNADVQVMAIALDSANKKAAVGGYLKGCIWVLAGVIIIGIFLWFYLPRLPRIPSSILPSVLP